MHYVYLLRLETDPKQSYISLATDLKKRINEHNRGDSPHPMKFRPWTLHAYFAFAEKNQAVRFERYLKSGSDRAFALRHLR
jgi:predicted GIY-YIG superfamily endonuclease